MTSWRLIAIGATAVLAGCSAAGPQPHVASAPEPSPAAVQARQTALQTQPSGGVEHWSDPATGARGSVTVVRTYRGPDGRWCRLIEETAEPASGGTASQSLYCRDPAGAWTLTAAG